MSGSSASAVESTGAVSMDFVGRVERVRAGLSDAGCEALVITNLVNIRYLTGFTGSAGLVWLSPDELMLVTDSRYTIQAADETTQTGVDVQVEIANQDAKVKEVLAKAATGFALIGLEANSVSWADQRRYAEWFSGIELVPAKGLVERCREIKDPGEINRMTKAAAIADAALTEALPLLLDSPTEKDMALAIDTAVRRRGASGSAFTTIVASGPNSALPHARPSNRTIGSGELVIVDMGAVVDGYRSDMTRTVIVGEPDAQATRVFETVRDAQELGVQQVVAGQPISQVDKACRDHIATHGWADAFVHGTGHGVGLDIHEDPWVRHTTTEVLEVGQVITVEPGVYLPGFGGVRVEDTVVVTPNGAHRLTQFPKTFVVA